MDPNPVQLENLNSGTRVWHNTSVRLNAHRRSTDIEGYCRRTSLAIGETLEVCVSSTAPFALDIFRMGFYGGTGARLVWQSGKIAGEKRGDPPVGDLQLRECDWPVSVAHIIPGDWTSGVYLGKLTQLDVPKPLQSYVIFVLHDDRTCDFLFKCSDTTWSAYNAWPDEYSLYEFHGDPPKVGYWGPDIQASWDRPYAMQLPWYGVHQPERLAWMVGASQFLIFEFPLLFWMESRGYDVSYISCVDLHETPAVRLRQRTKALVASGHDEYYSVGMHDNLQAAIDATDDMPEKGLSVAFFCGGSMTAVTSMAPSVIDPSRQNRIIRRLGRWGVIEQWLLAIQPEQGRFTDPFPDAGELMGARLVDPCLGVADWVCTNTQGPLASRLYSGTGLADGDRLRSVIGHEFTGRPVDKPGLEVLAEGHLVGDQGAQTPSTYTATLYPGPKGNFVFNSSTIWWAQWLNSSFRLPYPDGGEPRFAWVAGKIVSDFGDMQKVERMTINLFDMFLEGTDRGQRRGPRGHTRRRSRTARKRAQPKPPPKPKIAEPERETKLPVEWILFALLGRRFIEELGAKAYRSMKRACKTMLDEIQGKNVSVLELPYIDDICGLNVEVRIRAKFGEREKLEDLPLTRGQVRQTILAALGGARATGASGLTAAVVERLLEEPHLRVLEAFDSSNRSIPLGRRLIG